MISFLNCFKSSYLLVHVNQLNLIQGFILEKNNKLLAFIARYIQYIYTGISEIFHGRNSHLEYFSKYILILYIIII